MSTVKRVAGDYTIQTLGAGNLITLQSTTVVVTGDLSISGNTSIAGNISVTRIFNGTSNVDVGTSSGNVTVGIGGTGNVVVWATTGEYVTGLISATGNVTGGNILTAGLISATGNITGGNILGGANVNATTHTGTTASLSGNVTGGNILTGGLISATGNITGDNVSAVGYLGTSLSLTGNIVAAYVTANSDINAGNVYTTSAVSATGTVTGGNITTLGTVAAGAVSSTGNVTVQAGKYFVGDGGFLSNVTATSNVAVTQIANGTSLLAVSQTNGNITGAVNGISNVWVLSDVGITVTGLNSVTGNVIAGNVTTAGLVSAAGNVTAANFFGSGSGLTNIPGGNVSGTVANATYAVSAGSATTAGTVTTAAQPNITSVGTLSSVSVTGAITGGSLSVSTGNVTSGNLLISGAILDSAQLDIQTTAANANIVLTPNGTGNVNVGRVSASGNITAAAYYGSGAGLSDIAGGNVSGTVANATYAVSSGSAESATTAGTVTTNAQPNITSVGTLNSVSVTGNITGGNILGGANVNATTHTGTTASLSGNVTGGNILTGGLISATGNITGGNLIGTIVGNLTGTTVSASGNITGGNLSVGTGTITVNNIINGSTNGTGNIGNATNGFNTIFAKATSAQYADLAELYEADARYETGTVVVFGGEKEVTVSAIDGDHRVAGVISENPSFIMNSVLQAEHVAIVALAGRVPCKIQGSVAKGDLLVSAGNGVARSESTPLPGTIIGKALADFSGSTGVIEIAVGRA